MSIAWKEEFHCHRRTIKNQILTKNRWKIWEVEGFVLFPSHAHYKLAATMVPTIGLRRSEPLSSELFTFCYFIFGQPKKIVDVITSWATNQLRKHQNEFPNLIAHDAILKPIGFGVWPLSIFSWRVWDGLLNHVFLTLIGNFIYSLNVYVGSILILLLL